MLRRSLLVNPALLIITVAVFAGLRFVSGDAIAAGDPLAKMAPAAPH